MNVKDVGHTIICDIRIPMREAFHRHYAGHSGAGVRRESYSAVNLNIVVERNCAPAFSTVDGKPG